MTVSRETEVREPGPEIDRLAHEVIGAAIEVHRVLGPGLLESHYEEALCIELELRAIPFVRQQTVELRYKGRSIGGGRLDLLVGGGLVVELKAVDALLPLHLAQTLAYLRIAGHALALLINFNMPMLRDGVKRIVYTDGR